MVGWVKGTCSLVRAQYPELGHSTFFSGGFGDAALQRWNADSACGGVRWDFLDDVSQAGREMLAASPCDDSDNGDGVDGGKRGRRGR